ncbi:MAG: mechanosensitive ion channel family protein [Scytonema sp. PMC 1069.18]|nr:mechanosensitive ion channel family protein [Scytonema sp. PMC 1069.18]MEC4888064.1 mechanosensitive ion channel family protein [Scytonema sp. PMC 1070.18]
MRFQFLAIALSSTVTTVTIGAMPPTTAQIPFLPTVQTPTSGTSDSNTVVRRWVYLDGRRVFQVAAPKANISERIQDIQENLTSISQDYLRSSAANPKVEVTKQNNFPVIRVNDQYLMTITSQDANLRQVDPKAAADQISQLLEQSLRQAKLERQSDRLIQQGIAAGATLLTMMVLSWGLKRWQKRSSQLTKRQLAATLPVNEPITTQLKEQQHNHMQEVRRRLFQLAQGGVWGGGTFIILGIFPYTRGVQLLVSIALRIPVILGVVALGTYVVIRLSYALIDRFTSAVVRSSILTPETSERLDLRVSTISGVTKSLVTLIWVSVGILVALLLLGIDILPLLAGAGLVGVALSLASQNLIKDAINGFLIILEDQYALGDVIAVGDVGGLVENLNLRMTQVRDAEGRLITIPNSEIRIVANLSSRWSRADLTIPVAYQTDIDEAMKLIETVALDMDADPKWQRKIIEPPQVLGIDNFDARGLLIRVWIKTQPLKQWDVAREYRRRLKVAFDKAGLSIPVPQQSVWVNNNGHHLLASPQDGRG